MSVHAAALVTRRFSMSFNIPPEFERAVMERVESGEYQSTDDVLRACLAALAREEAEEAEKLEALRRDVEHAMDQYERGKYSPADEVFARLRAKLQPDPVS